MFELKTRRLEPEADWFFFHPDDPVSAEDRSLIRPLKLEAAHSIWEELVSNVASEDHPMLVPQGHWLYTRQETRGDWREEWARRSSRDALVHFLRLQIDWPDEADVLFVWRREDAVSVPWGVFLRDWRCFLFDDEGPFLVRPGFPEFVFFSPTGFMATGRRDHANASPFH